MLILLSCTTKHGVQATIPIYSAETAPANIRGGMLPPRMSPWNVHTDAALFTGLTMQVRPQSSLLVDNNPSWMIDATFFTWPMKTVPNLGE